MIRVAIKPLSVNEAYKGRHFPTVKLTAYKETLSYLLPKMAIPAGRLSVSYIFGLSSKSADADNCVKAFTDALCRRYGFDDRMIFRFEVEKRIVPKGKEFAEFEIKTFDPKQ
jgi:Holliday junction resolvase RusA-like endonuclease